MVWFNAKFFNEVSHWLVREKVYKRFMSAEHGGGGPDMQAVRAARSNLRYHLRYIGHLIRARNWLAGDRLTYADLAAAAHLILPRLFGRRAVGRERNRQNLVRAGEVATVVPASPGRSAAGDRAQRDLRRSRLLASLKEKARALGFDACGSHLRRPAAPGARTPRRLARRGRARRHGLDGGRARAARGSARAHAGRQEPHHARRQLWAGQRSPVGAWAEIRRRDLGLCPRSRLSRRRQGQAERACGVPHRIGATRTRRRQGVRRHGAADGEAARRASGRRLAGQAHKSCVARHSALGCS